MSTSSAENHKNNEKHDAGSTSQRLIGCTFSLRTGEHAPVLLGVAMLFCLMCSYYMLKPVRDAIGTEEVQNLQWLYLGTLSAMLLLSPAFAWLVSVLPSQRFIPITFRFFALNLLIFFGLLQWQPDNRFFTIAYFIWVSVFNVFIVSVFWALMADSFRTEQSKRLFGYLAVGGMLGQLAGSSVASVCSQRLSMSGVFWVLIFSALMLEAAVQVSLAFMRRRSSSTTNQEQCEPLRHAFKQAGWKQTLNGISSVARSGYLLLICLFLFAYTLSSTFVDFAMREVMEAEVASRAERTALWARMEQIIALVTIALQVVLTGRIMSRLGVGVTLAILPLLTLAGFIGAASIARAPGNETATPSTLSPILLVLCAVFVARRCANFAFARPARESLFTVLTRDEKYKSKNFMDTFVYRAGDQLGAFGFRALSDLARFSLAQILWLFVPIAALWTVVAFILGRMQSSRARSGQN